VLHPVVLYVEFVIRKLTSVQGKDYLGVIKIISDEQIRKGKRVSKFKENEFCRSLAFWDKIWPELKYPVFMN